MHSIRLLGMDKLHIPLHAKNNPLLPPWQLVLWLPLPRPSQNRHGMLAEGVPPNEALTCCEGQWDFWHFLHLFGPRTGEKPGLLALSFTIWFSPWLWLSTASGCCHCIDDTWVPGSLTSQGLWALIGLIRMLCSEPKRSASNDEEAVWTQWEIQMRTRSWAYGLAPAELSCPENPSEAPVCPVLPFAGSLQWLEQHCRKGNAQILNKEESSLQDGLIIMRITKLASLFNHFQVHRATPASSPLWERKETDNQDHWTWYFTRVYLLDLQRGSTLPGLGWEVCPEVGLAPQWLSTGVQSQFCIAQKPSSIFRTFQCTSSLTFTNTAPISIRKQDFIWTSISFLLAVYLRLELMNHAVTL